MPEDTYEELETSEEPWFCVLCISIKENNIEWGDLKGEEGITKLIKETYNEVTTWRKNLFMLPRGKAGTDFIREKTRLLYLFINDTRWSRVALALVHIFSPLMLQKPSSKSKARDNAAYLQKRLNLWTEGKIDELIAEGREIQKRLETKMKNNNNNNMF